MIGIVVVTHGKLSEELVRATEHVVGSQTAFQAISIEVEDDVEARRDEIRQTVKESDQGHGVIILTDMFGGTPSNMSLSFHDEHQVEVVTGMNLPMLIKLATLRDAKPLDELAAFIKAYGQRNISVASELVPEGEP